MGTGITTEGEMQRKAPQPSERPVSAKAAAEFLQMHVRSVTRLAGVGHIPGHPIGYGQRTKWLFYISELDAMLWELVPLERNPMGLVELKGVSRRLRPPRILTEEGQHAAT
jgi:hypothetical protein